MLSATSLSIPPPSLSRSPSLSLTLSLPPSLPLSPAIPPSLSLSVVLFPTSLSHFISTRDTLSPHVPSRDFKQIFNQKWAGLTVDQKVFLFSIYVGLSSRPGSPPGFSVNAESVLQTTMELAEGSFRDQKPSSFCCSINGPFEGDGPGICKLRNRIFSKIKAFLMSH